MILTATKFQALQDACGKREVWASAEWAAILAAHHLTPGTDVVRALMSAGAPESSARRQADAALEVLGPRPPDPEHALRRALADALYHLENPTAIIPANRVRQLRQLAGVRLVEAGTSFERGLEGSARAAAKWTADEVAQVDAAIEAVADRCRNVRTFTADDVWVELGSGFLVTKGLAGRLIAAANRGVLVNMGRTVLSKREGEHGHGQRLTVWGAGHASRRRPRHDRAPVCRPRGGPAPVAHPRQRPPPHRVRRIHRRCVLQSRRHRRNRT
jgi:hypothetical protein